MKNLQLCTNCLRPGHNNTHCRATPCRTCKGKHHTLLHFTLNKPTTLYDIQTEKPSESVNLNTNNTRVVNTTTTNNRPYTTTEPKAAILSTALVDVLDINHKRHTLKALLDSGSQSNFITERVFNILNIPYKPINMQVLGFNANPTHINRSVNIDVLSRHNSYKINMSCLVVPTICNITLNTTKLNLTFPEKYVLADASFFKPSEIDLLIGAELFYNILGGEQYIQGKGHPPTKHKIRMGVVRPNNNTKRN